jgi:hypothetical protein
VGRKGSRKSYYMLWPGKTNPSEAERLVCIGIIGRQKQLRVIRQTFLTQNMPQREVPHSENRKT